jgi:two-component system, LytTR family, sensor kinase
MDSRILSNKRITILLHLTVWLIIWALPRYILNVYGDGNVDFLHQFYAETIILGLLFYLNYLWLVPRFFLEKKRILYFILAIVIILVLIKLMNWLNDNVFFDPDRAREFEKVMEEINKGKEVIKPPFRQFRIYGYFYKSFFIWGFSLGLAVFNRFRQNEKIQKELEKEKLNSELAMLKNQVSPHFFFNTLNNIYSLINLDSAKAQESVHKLSKLMRYLLYESEQGKCSLSDEIAFMEHYIDLMKLRLNEKVKLSIEFPSEHPDLKVPPLLFVPFIENAFKHGISYREPSFVKIKLVVVDSTINLLVINSRVSHAIEKDGIHSGIGLPNVKKRLQLLYPNHHHLKIKETDKEFSIALTLDLRNNG